MQPFSRRTGAGTPPDPPTAFDVTAAEKQVAAFNAAEKSRVEEQSPIERAALSAVRGPLPHSERLPRRPKDNGKPEHERDSSIPKLKHTAKIQQAGMPSVALDSLKQKHAKQRIV